MRGYAWIWLGLLAALGAAGVAILGRLGMQQVDTVLGTALRSVVMSIALVALAGVTGAWRALGSGRVEIDARTWLYVVGAGVCGAASWLAYFAALKLANAGPVAALDRLSLPLVLVLGVVFLGEQVGWRGWLGVTLVLGGTYLIASEQLTAASA